MLKAEKATFRVLLKPLVLIKLLNCTYCNVNSVGYLIKKQLKWVKFSSFKVLTLFKGISVLCKLP